MYVWRMYRREEGALESGGYQVSAWRVLVCEGAL